MGIPLRFYTSPWEFAGHTWQLTVETFSSKTKKKKKKATAVDFVSVASTTTRLTHEKSLSLSRTRLVCLTIGS